MNSLKNRTKKINFKKIVLFVAVSLLFVGLGFAALKETFSINADMALTAKLWDVQFEDLNVISGEEYATKNAKISDDDPTKVEFSLNFVYPGDSYEFSVDVANKGVIDAKLINFKINGLPKYLKFNVKYGNGDTVTVNDVLPVGGYETLIVKIYYVSLADPTYYPTSAQNIETSFTITYEQDDGNGTIRQFKLVDLIKNDAIFDTDINFGEAPSEENGQGVFLREGTEKDIYPIYYYRGLVDNNNVLFADQCWKIVRTTELGGIKLIYNGPPSKNKCTNTTQSTTRLSTNYEFNSYSSPSLANVGYMYGTIYNYSSAVYSGYSYYYGNDVTYNHDTKQYYLVDEKKGTATSASSDGTKRHYTCMATTEGAGCATVYYVYYSNLSISLSDGKNIEDAKNEMFANINPSPVLTALNEWYETNIETTGFTKYLEDAVWCNDRTIESGGLKSKDAESGYIYFSSYNASEEGRGLNSTTPLPAVKDAEACPNVNDQFTTGKATYGNGALKYPIGMLTADEVTLAGSGYTGSNDNYLYNGYNNWTLTPAFMNNYYIYGFRYSGSLTIVNISTTTSVRPSIVLKNEIIRESGDGTTGNPYTIKKIK